MCYIVSTVEYFSVSLLFSNNLNKVIDNSKINKNNTEYYRLLKINNKTFKIHI